MNRPVSLIVSTAFACGFAALAASAATAMPLARVGVEAAPAAQEAHAVRVCGPRGCYWTHAGHRHGWRHYGWRPHRHYHYGWRRHWR